MGEKQTRARNHFLASVFHLIRDRRGVSAIEYGLLLVAILVLVAGGYRLLGKRDQKATQVAEATIVGNADWAPSGGGSGDRGIGGGSNTPGGNSPSGDLCDGRSCGAPGSCFVAGTQVATPSGEQPIESLHAGDPVLARSAGGDVEVRPIVRTFVHPAHALVDVHTVTVDEVRDRVRSTPEHPYFTLGHGWKAAGDLGAGETLVDRAGHEVQVTKVVRIAQEAEVYNFEVDVDHTYFVGSRTKVLVHNACGDPDFKDYPRPDPAAGAAAVHAESTAVTDAQKAANDAKKAADKAKAEQNKADRMATSVAAGAKIPPERVQKVKDDAAAAQASANQAKLDAENAKTHAESLAPAAENQHIHDTLDKIPGKGSTDWGANAPPGKMGDNWGVEYGNNGGDLPAPAKASPSPYREYRVDPGGTATDGKAGSRRIVIDTRNGDAYYTWTHYGSHGDPAFVKIRNGWP
ncbi:Hint domain-containing protein [Pendulispora rubella]|uniref:Hint domain-containing protein n=1 Tax=Pendulispora rubella TaxID=2741070 RepID=A0ABZ2LFB6_9BACT